MDYKEFKERIEKYVIVPTKEQKSAIIENVDSIHFSIFLNYENQSHMGKQMGEMVDFIYVLEERGSVFEHDFFVTAHFVETNPRTLLVVLHMMKEFASDEDFDPSYQRFGIRK